MSSIGTRELAAALRHGDITPLWRWLGPPAPTSAPGEAGQGALAGRLGHGALIGETAQEAVAAATHLAVIAASGRDDASRGWIALGPRVAVCADRAALVTVEPTVVALWLVDRIDLGSPALSRVGLTPTAVDVAVLEAALGRDVHSGDRRHRDGRVAPQPVGQTGRLDPAWAGVLDTVEGWWTLEGGPLTRPPLRVDTLVTPGGLVAVDRSGSAARLTSSSPWARLAAALVPLCLDPHPATEVAPSPG